MSIFGGIGRAIARPFKGVGKLATGDFKGGINDLAGTAKLGAALTPWGLPAAIAIGAGAGGLESATEDGASLGSVAGGIAGGGLKAGIGSKILGAGKGAASGVTGAASDGVQASQGLGSRILGAGKGVGNWAKENPELATTAASVMSSAYGANQEGAMLDEQIAYQREQEQRERERREAMDPIMQDIVMRLLQQPAA